MADVNVCGLTPEFGAEITELNPLRPLGPVVVTAGGARGDTSDVPQAAARVDAAISKFGRLDDMLNVAGMVDGALGDDRILRRGAARNGSQWAGG